MPKQVDMKHNSPIPTQSSRTHDKKAEARHEHQIIWGNHPNDHYFAYFVENRRNSTGKIDDGSTLEEVLASPRKALAAARQYSASVASDPITISIPSTVDSETSGSSDDRRLEPQVDLEEPPLEVSNPKFSTPPPKKTTVPTVKSQLAVDTNLSGGAKQVVVPPFIYVGDSPLTVRVQTEDFPTPTKTTTATMSRFDEGFSQFTMRVLLVVLVLCLIGIAVGVIVFLQAQQ